MLKHFFRNNSGSALVELALTTPLLILMLVAAAELGRIAYAAIEVQNAARAGAAYGAQSSGVAFAPGSANAMELAANNDVPNIADLAFPTAPTTACVCEKISSSGTPSYSPTSGTVSCGDPTIKSCSTAVNSTSTQQVVEYVVVNTQAVVKTMFHYPGIPTSFTLNGYSQIRAIQN